MLKLAEGVKLLRRIAAPVAFRIDQEAAIAQIDKPVSEGPVSPPRINFRCSG
jgi:hypothetical protein